MEREKEKDVGEDMKLGLPERKYYGSYIRAGEECEREGITTYHFTNKDEDELFRYFENCRNGNNLPEGRVPSTYLWLTDGDEFIGEVSIRHFLNENLEKRGGHAGYGIRYGYWNKGFGTFLLRESLKYLKEKLGINHVLITCNDDNTASASVIEKNGGILKDKIWTINIDGEVRKEHLTRRYWIGS